jgi:hypothetical protein
MFENNSFNCLLNESMGIWLVGIPGIIIHRLLLRRLLLTALLQSFS